MKRHFVVAATLFWLGLSAIPVLAAVSVSVSPKSAQVALGGNLQFQATVSGTSDSIVIWSATGAGCVGITCGSITGAGLYSAPTTAPSPNVVTVTATSLADVSVSASATVTIGSGSGVSVTISPGEIRVGVGGKQQFSANVTGTSNGAVTWAIAGNGCAGNTCGTVSSTGLYTAPSVPPNPAFFSLTATSVADPSKSASAAVTVVKGVSITISPTSAKLAPGASRQFTAHVAGASNTAVSWSLSGAGCAGASCGTISSSGLYTAPAVVPNPSIVTVTTTSQADTTKSASARVTIVNTVKIAISPTNALLIVGTQQQFLATVTGSTNTAVAWSVSGSGCSGSACGTVSNTGLYTAPATVPNPAAVKVIATAQANSSQSAAAAVTIAPTSNSKLNGQYAFLFRGFDSQGVYDAAGYFVADGNGNITSGMEDINRRAGPKTGIAISGTYQVSSDNRGTLGLKSSLGSFAFSFALNGTAQSASLIETDTSGIRGSGVFKLQDPMAFDPSVFSGGYAVGLTGVDAQGRVGAIGAIFPSGVGTISGSSLDVNDGGDLLPTFAPFSGTYSVGAAGRGQATLVVPGFELGTVDFALYVVSASEYFVVSTDPYIGGNPILAGTIEAQTDLPFATSSFHGASVFGLTGSNGDSSQVTVGRMQFDGAGNITVQSDQNSGGNIAIGSVMTGAYSVQLNGRGVLTLDNSVGAPSIWILYATAPNQGFLLTSDGSVSSGDLYNQAITPPFETGDIVGEFQYGSGEPASSQAYFASGTVAFDGASKVSGTEDTNHSGTSTKNVAMAGTYAISMVSNNGRGVILLSSPVATDALWVISGMEAIGLDVDATNTNPTLMKFKQ